MQSRLIKNISFEYMKIHLKFIYFAKNDCGE